MSATVRFLNIELHNFKNVIHGKVSFPQTTDESMLGHNIIGVYGQNGSGKTALVQAFEVIKKLKQGETLEDNFIFHGQDSAQIALEFEIYDEMSYRAIYEIEIALDKNQKSSLKREILTYRLDAKRKRSQQIIYNPFEDNISEMLQILDKGGNYIPFKNLNENEIFEIKLAQRLGNSLLLSYPHQEFFERIDVVGNKILKALKLKLGINTVIISSNDNHHIYADKLLPMPQQLTKMGSFNFIGGIPLRYDKSPSVIEQFSLMVHQSVLKSINIVLPQLVPGLTIELNELGKETMPDGNQGVRVEFLSVRDNKRIPLYYESTGIKKIISILSALIALFNQTEIFVIIDELDAGIFEFLLGELLEVLNQNIAGQLLFTSHNLRLLEVLEKENLVFTTTNPQNRFIRMKGLRDTHNVRDRYIRAVQLGGQDEELYAQTDAYYIKRAFRKAGAVKS